MRRLDVEQDNHGPVVSNAKIHGLAEVTTQLRQYGPGEVDTEVVMGDLAENEDHPPQHVPLGLLVLLEKPATDQGADDSVDRARRKLESTTQLRYPPALVSRSET